MKTMKKALYAVCLAAAILLSLGSCSSNENQYDGNFSQVLAALDCGEGAKEAAEAAFGPSDSDYIRCEGQLSRKNDFIPALSKVLQP